MQIVEPDFTMEVDGFRYNLTFNKRVKKRDTGQYAIEPGDTLYGLTLASAIERIVKHRTAKKWGEENISLKEYLKEYKKQHNEMIRLCAETPPENFDTGE